MDGHAGPMQFFGFVLRAQSGYVSDLSLAQMFFQQSQIKYLTTKNLNIGSRPLIYRVHSHQTPTAVSKLEVSHQSTINYLAGLNQTLTDVHPAGLGSPRMGSPSNEI
jgi:hypothetical protein